MGGGERSIPTVGGRDKKEKNRQKEDNNAEREKERFRAKNDLHILKLRETDRRTLHGWNISV